MLRTIAITLLTACAAFGQTVDMGRLPDLTWTWDGQAHVSSFSSGGNWWDGMGLASMWPIDEGVGTNVTDVIDSAPAYFTAAPLWTNIYGQACARFLTASTTINAKDVYDPGTNSWSWGVWVCVTSAPAIGVGLVSKAPGFGYETQFFMSTDRKLTFTARNSTGSLIIASLTAATRVPTNGWYHAGIVVDRTHGLHLYLDGVLDGHSTNRLDGINFQSTRPFTVGSIDAIANRTVPGFVRDAYVAFNTSTNHAVTIYNASKSRYGK